MIFHHLKVTISLSFKIEIKKIITTRIIILKTIIIEMVILTEVGITIKKIMVIQNKIIKTENPFIEIQER
ncbi:hypothetical protein RBH29_08030 [Herbivorax sp. ANBcel31]|uniref:hypothetical protein n=1 Tax=Herbivorax sp. ANBcel31 TaxID=3069754 RepID=UPI0027B02C81|nr:hypothetical protein [Herbivorax sp. ANBcel31]MDQ2086376.1 hypothetical protein [Herbivorax sp. ANBcel31]